MRRKLKLYGVFFFAVALLYLSFMSIGLDDFDSFAFAFALERWDTALIEVHPPSFPIYVFIAKFVQLLVSDTRLALTIVSAISGAFAIVLTVMIPVTMDNKRVGIIAGVLLIFLPGYWLNSELALSDIPGITIALLSTVLLLNASENRSSRYFVMGCFFAGISLGVRPHNIIPIALAGLYALYSLRILKTELVRQLIFGGLALSVGIVMWLIPLYNTFDGFNDQPGLNSYIERLSNHSQHIQTSDSLFRQDITSASVNVRINNFVDGWTHLIAGRHQVTMLVMTVLMLIGLVKLPLRHRLTWFLLLWFILEAIKIFVFASLERPRLFLPALIPLILLVALGYSNWHTRFRWVRIGVIALVLILFHRALPIIIELNQILPPPEQATAYVLDNYPLHSGTALLVSQGSFQAAQYHLGHYKQLYTQYFDAESWANNIAFDRPDYLIILDGDDIAPEIFDALTSELNYVTIDDRIFERDPRVFPQHSTVRLQVMIQEKDLQPEQLTLPESGLITVGSAEHGKYFGDGWYRIEVIGDTLGRWSNQSAVLRASLPVQDTSLSFVATPYLGGQVVEVIVNDTVVDTIEINQIWGTYHLTISASILAKREISTIEFKHTLAEYPENHNRRLATAYRDFRFE